MNYEDLVGIGEIADRCGVSQQVVSNWFARWDDWPPPVRDLKMGPLFSWRKIERCLQAHEREYA